MENIKIFYLIIKYKKMNGTSVFNVVLGRLSKRKYTVSTNIIYFLFSRWVLYGMGKYKIVHFF